MKIKQKDIARRLKLTPGYINHLVSTRKRPNWKRAKQLAKITGTDPVLWLEGTYEQIKKALNGDK